MQLRGSSDEGDDNDDAASEESKSSIGCKMTERGDANGEELAAGDLQKSCCAA
jgi:hypothetical protein